MSVSEFSLIERYFAAHRFQRSDVALGIGDDCALLLPPTGQQLATTVDTLVSGVHFFADADPESVGHKALLDKKTGIKERTKKKKNRNKNKKGEKR